MTAAAERATLAASGLVSIAETPSSPHPRATRSKRASASLIAAGADWSGERRPRDAPEPWPTTMPPRRRSGRRCRGTKPVNHITRNHVNLQPKPCQTNGDSIRQASIETTRVPAQTSVQTSVQTPVKALTRRRLLDRGPIVARCPGCALLSIDEFARISTRRVLNDSSRMTESADSPSRRAVSGIGDASV